MFCLECFDFGIRQSLIGVCHYFIMPKLFSNVLYNTDMAQSSSSWGSSSKWYGKVVGREGHYYHQHTVIPSVLRLLHLNESSKLLDIGCGQGVLARSIPPEVEYWGVDIASSLLKQAKDLDVNKKHHYVCSDVVKQLPVPVDHFTHAAIVLALQNMSDANAVIKRVAVTMAEGSTLVILLNHPCFRIPRQSGWDVDPQAKQQRRWINRYMTPMDIPIVMHPGVEQSEMTKSFHLPLSSYITSLAKAGFVVNGMEELVSDKESVGKAAKMENRSRSDIPLFMAIRARKTG